MRLKVVLHMLGVLIIFIGIFELFPLLWSIFYQEEEAIVFLVCILITLGAGCFLKRLGKYAENITLKESFAFVTLGWVLAGIFGSFPFYFAGIFTNYVDAFFESMSGFTTTGATVIEDIEKLGHGILIWRSMTQWLGGMGIIALFVAVLPRLGGGTFYLFRAEIPGPVKEKIVPRIAETAKILWGIYLFISLAQFIMLLLSGLSVFDSFNHTFTTMATGGFSTRNESIAAFNNPFTEGVIIAFMFMAGVNFSLYYALFRGNIKSIFQDYEFRFYLSFLAVTGLIVSIILFLYTYDSIFDSIRYGFFQVVSITTTTGFATDDFNEWPPFLRGVLFFLKFMGGCGGSTGGSIKQIRIIVAAKLCFREVYRIIHPRAVIPVRLGNKSISENVAMNIAGFVLFYILIFVVSSLLMTSFGLELVSAFSAVAATLGNVGPGLDLVGPLETYAPIPSPGKILLSFLMLVGRLEIFTVMVLLLGLIPKSWFPSNR
ncbi:MAG: TrkH family potassium uptake protein [Candidatus Syntrophonatronum acetioxidans]|uniref:TrkH family potassium uptake protein n=1 Tax=Candidatus Syntrophonatronum acetioxidans TaxID=1795816 RepID=A0A424YFN6_9FIRM|nr:MAG: TrkH family potassium uptake protein [Candidatus Syntrophonatronum acetioxidans]